ncbi:MAG: hypothetical protein ACRCT2_17455 [Plesiomonas shigelloides]
MHVDATLGRTQEYHVSKSVELCVAASILSEAGRRTSRGQLSAVGAVRVAATIPQKHASVIQGIFVAGILILLGRTRIPRFKVAEEAAGPRLAKQNDLLVLLPSTVGGAVNSPLQHLVEERFGITFRISCHVFLFPPGEIKFK